MKKEKVKNTDFELLVPGGERLWLEHHAQELSSIWGEIVKMHQLTEISLSFRKAGNIFVFQNQVVNINLNGGANRDVKGTD
jgi:hypothetical protein